MEKKYSITLANGDCISDLVLNGNNFISNEYLDKSLFEDNLSEVIISDGENERVHYNMELIQLTKDTVEHKTWFILRDIPTDKLERLRLQADIEYLAMMAGVKL